MLAFVTGSTRVAWVSIGANIDNITDALFRQTPRYETPVTVSVLVLLGLLAVSISVLERRVRGVEIVVVSAPILTAEHLSKWYGQVIGLNDVTVNVPPGITGLLGPNGAGKSTFMKLITGQLRPSKGDGHACSASRSGATRSCSSASDSVPSRTRSTTG